MTHFVICERGHECDNRECSYTRPFDGSTMTRALCGYINKRVNVIEYQEVPTCDPNYIFKRKKHGL